MWEQALLPWAQHVSPCFATHAFHHIAQRSARRESGRTQARVAALAAKSAAKARLAVSMVVVVQRWLASLSLLVTAGVSCVLRMAVLCWSIERAAAAHPSSWPASKATPPPPPPSCASAPIPLSRYRSCASPPEAAQQLAPPPHMHLLATVLHSVGARAVAVSVRLR